MQGFNLDLCADTNLPEGGLIYLIYSHLSAGVVEEITFDIKTSL